MAQAMPTTAQEMGKHPNANKRQYELTSYMAGI
jgi:hypothetical protein